MNSKMILKLAIWVILTVILVIAIKDGLAFPMGDAIELWFDITVEIVRDFRNFADKKRRR